LSRNLYSRFSLTGTKSTLRHVLRDHNNCCGIIDLFNKNAKILNIIFYYCSVTFTDIILILALLDRTNTIARAITIYVTICTIFVITLPNYSMSMIPREVNSFYPKLNSLIVRSRLQLRMKLKVCSLIEKISGPVIGLYCFDFFPFTNYEFYIFSVNCTMSFILFMGLLY